MPDVRIEDINASLVSSPLSFVMEVEREYAERIESISRLVAENRAIKVIFISGPSSSGKTTTSNLLADSIIRRGRHCMVVSLDDFYRSPTEADYPTLPDGRPDFEVVEALDLPLLTRTLSCIASEEEFLLPKFDFKSSSRVSLRPTEPPDGSVVIIEGLHALNPKIFSAVPKEASLKIFISVSTNVTKGRERIISGRKLRYLRRTVRDSIYRATPPERTLALWSSVISGEDKYLYPTRIYADMEFNTFHAYELSLMRPFAESLLTDAVVASSELARVAREAVSAAVPMDITLVPETSLMREFVPGGIYEDLY